VKIERVEWWRYRVPFRRPFATASGVLTEREGLIVRLTDSDGVTGLGEAPPLESFGTGTVGDAQRQIEHLAPRIQGTHFESAPDLIRRTGDDPTTAPLRFALDTAFHDCLARREGQPLARFLSEDAAGHVPINATNGERDAASAVELTRTVVAQGYTAIKLKVGVFDGIRQEVERITAVREAAGSEIELRLDANGAWGYERARRICALLSGLEIAYLEQPLAPDDIGGSRRLRRDFDIPIALDESATTIASIQEIISRNAADVIIIKPGVVGGICQAREVIQRATEAGLRAVVTTTLETGIGVAAALHLAATLPAPIPACGLGTLQLLRDDLLTEPLSVHRGWMTVPDGPGLGIDIDWSRLPGARFAE
jgi:L-Ala-D/L-Glu epimerase